MIQIMWKACDSSVTFSNKLKPAKRKDNSLV